MILNAERVYRALRNRNREELSMLKDQLERSGYEIRPKGPIGDILERHGFDLHEFGLVAVKENHDRINHEYFVVGERDGVFSRQTDAIRGEYKEDQFSASAIEHIENNPCHITRYMVRRGWPAVCASSLITGVLSAHHWNSNLAGAAMAGAVVVGATALTHLVRRGFEYYLRNYQGVYYGQHAVRSVIGQKHAAPSHELV
ncbi:MAG: hypothetical protein HY512_02205 [Candidatus Aenigmarchaeota archaeon]|nr:hypothetical protein [Candidatus Aenigmarchaeota archaeon]